jgi:hypothetical protein
MEAIDVASRRFSSNPNRSALIQGEAAEVFLCGFAALRLCGFAALRLCGFAALRLCGFAALRLCGFAALRLCVTVVFGPVNDSRGAVFDRRRVEAACS